MEAFKAGRDIGLVRLFCGRVLWVGFWADGYEVPILGGAMGKDV